MNQKRSSFSGGMCIILLSAFLATMTGAKGSEIRQRSDGCGPHPLIALAAASRPFGSGTPSLHEILRAVKAEPEVWSAIQVLLRQYDDCIRAGDGLHYKRSGPPAPVQQQLYGSSPADTQFLSFLLK